GCELDDLVDEYFDACLTRDVLTSVGAAQEINDRQGPAKFARRFPTAGVFGSDGHSAQQMDLDHPTSAAANTASLSVAGCDFNGRTGIVGRKCSLLAFTFHWRRPSFG